MPVTTHTPTACERHTGLRRIDIRQAVLLARYHLRVLGWGPFLLMLLSFLGAGILLRIQLQNAAEGLGLGTELSRFVMEPGAALFAAVLGSSLVMNDPLLEVNLATRTGAHGLVIWRALLSVLPLLLCSAVYLVWSLTNGVSYARQQSPLYLLLVWLAPALFTGMLGLFGSLVTRNAALGFTIAVVPLAASLFLSGAITPIKGAHLFLVSYTFSGGQDAPDWWANRLALLAGALLFAAWSGWLLRRDERLVNGLR